MFDIDKYMIAEESSVSIKVIGSKISSAVKLFLENFRKFFLKKNPATEGLFRAHSMSSNVAIDKVCNWLEKNMSVIRAKDDDELLHLDASDNSKEMELAFHIADTLKRVAWEREIPLMTFTMTNTLSKTKVVYGVLRSNWNSSDILGIGVPVIIVDVPFSKINEAIDTGKRLKVNVVYVLEIHWDARTPEKIDTTPFGSSQVEICQSTLEFRPKK